MAIITVKASGGTFNLTQLQNAIDAANDGDTITIEAGQQCTGFFTLRNKGTLTAGITITTTLPEFCPPAGTRTGPSYASFMPKLKSGGGGSPVLQTAAGANGWTLRHIWFAHVPFGFENILNIGTNDSAQTFRSQQPFNITIDRCVGMGGPVCGQKRFAILHGANLTVSNCYVDNIYSYGTDSQSLACVNGSGPITVTNNWLRGGSYTFIAGGADPNILTMMTITGTPTTTTCDVTCAVAGHTLTELAIGDGLGLAMTGITGGWQWTTIRGISGTGASGTLTFDAIPTPPTVGANNARAGVILGERGAVNASGDGLTFAFNHCGNDPAWFNRGAIDTPTNLTATIGAGSLAAGSYWYSVQAQHTTETFEGTLANGYSIRTAEVTKTLVGSGSVALSWTAVTNADQYIVWRGTSAGAPTAFKTVTTNSLSDDGSFGWTLGTPKAASTKQFKNIFELKAVQNAHIHSCIFEYVKQGVDIGYATWWKTVNQGGNGTFLQSKNIVYEDSILRHCFGAFEIHGRERADGTVGFPGTLDGLTIRNILVYDSGPQYSNNGTSDQYASFCSAANNVTFDHITLIHTTGGGGGGWIGLDSGDLKLAGFSYKNSLVRKETFGAHDSNGLGNDGAAFTVSTTGGFTVTKNAIADGGSAYPAGNFTESAALWQAEFINYVADGTGADFHLKSSSAYHNAGTDGKDLGCDIDRVLNATATVMSGIPGSSPSLPDTPTAPSPAHTQTGVSTSPTLTWSGASALNWDVYFGTSSNPPLVASGVTVANYTPAALLNNTQYFWKIVARNDAGTTTGPIWSFTTLAQVTGPAHHRHGRFHR